jgi:hypothetical protein
MGRWTEAGSHGRREAASNETGEKDGGKMGEATWAYKRELKIN